jgi:DNA-binding NarL/FixJ family response regulator
MSRIMTSALQEDSSIVWLLWLHEQLGFSDMAEWGRAGLAWRYELTRAEIQLVELIASGCTNDQIAERLELSEVNTVKKRIDKIFEKIGVNNRVLVAAMAARLGLGDETGGFRRPKV